MAEILKTEAEFAAKFIEYFPDWDIYEEVPVDIKSSTAGSIDIYGVKGIFRMAAEVKLKTNWSIAQQGYRNRAFAHYSYICVPKPKTVENFFLMCCRDYGIGVLFYENGAIKEIVKPKINKNIKKRQLEDWMKNSTAGTLHGRESAYSFALSRIIQQLQRSPGGKMNIRNVFERTTYHWSSISSAKNCILLYIRKGIIKNITHEKGYLILKPSKTGTSNSQNQDPEKNPQT